MIQAAEPAGGGSGFTTILFLLLLFGVVYFMMIRPQQKRRRESLEMQRSLGPGDQIVTIGGLHGTVVTVDDDVATIEVAPGVVVRFARPAIARVVPKADGPAEPESEELAAEEPVDNPATDPTKKD